MAGPLPQAAEPWLCCPFGLGAGSSTASCLKFRPTCLHLNWKRDGGSRSSWVYMAAVTACDGRVSLPSPTPHHSPLEKLSPGDLNENFTHTKELEEEQKPRRRKCEGRTSLRLVRAGRGSWGLRGSQGWVCLQEGGPGSAGQEGGRRAEEGGAGPAPSTGLGEKPRRTRLGPADGHGRQGGPFCVVQAVPALQGKSAAMAAALTLCWT